MSIVTCDRLAPLLSALCFMGGRRLVKMSKFVDIFSRILNLFLTCSLFFPLFFSTFPLAAIPHTPHTRTQLCKKPRKVCHHWTFGAPCFAIAQLMDRLRERCFQDLLPEFTSNVAPFFQLVMILSNGFIDVESHVPSHMVCHAAMEHVIHVTIHAKKQKPVGSKFQVLGLIRTAAVLQGNVPGYSVPSRFQTDKTKWIWKNWRHLKDSARRVDLLYDTRVGAPSQCLLFNKRMFT